MEREVAELSPDERQRIRQARAKPILDEFHDWLTRHHSTLSYASLQPFLNDWIRRQHEKELAA